MQTGLWRRCHFTIILLQVYGEFQLPCQLFTQVEPYINMNGRELPMDYLFSRSGIRLNTKLLYLFFISGHHISLPYCDTLLNNYVAVWMI